MQLETGECMNKSYVVVNEWTMDLHNLTDDVYISLAMIEYPYFL